MKLIRTFSAFVGIALAAASISAQTATPLTATPCVSVNQSVSATDYVKLSLVNDNFKIGDLVFVPATNTSAVHAAQAKYNRPGLTWVTLCNGSVVIFVNNPNYSWDQIEAVYDKLTGAVYAHAAINSIRPTDREDLL